MKLTGEDGSAEIEAVMLEAGHSGFPETGLKVRSLWRNWHIASLMVAVAISYIGFGLVAPLRTLYARAEGATGAEAGLMAAAFLFSGFVFLFPFGWLSDRVNRVALIVAGLVAHGIITLAYLPVSSGELFIGLRFVEGISSAAVIPAARALLADLVPPGRNGEGFGLLSAMMTFGMFAGPPFGTFLAQIFGFGMVYALASLAFIPAIGLVIFAFRGYHPEHKRTGYFKGKARPAEPSEKLLTAPVLAGCLMRAAVSLGPGLGASIWSLYMADLGFELSLIGWTYTVYAIPMVLVAPWAGRLSDRYGRILPMCVGGAMLSLCWTSYGLLPSFLLFMLMGVVEGSFDAVARSANDGYLADHTPANSRGRAQGLFNAVTQFGSLAGAVMAGFLYETGKSVPFIVLGSAQLGLVLVATAILVAIKRRDRVAKVSLELGS